MPELSRKKVEEGQIFATAQSLSERANTDPNFIIRGDSRGIRLPDGWHEIQLDWTNFEVAEYSRRPETMTEANAKNVFPQMPVAYIYEGMAHGTYNLHPDELAVFGLLEKNGKLNGDQKYLIHVTPQPGSEIYKNGILYTTAKKPIRSLLPDGIRFKNLYEVSAGKPKPEPKPETEEMEIEM